ncbi:MAG: hypothetical protein Q4F38_09390 [Akkermansia sp.]|nr:hypothetical protein [Akkermansia sp.]
MSVEEVTTESWGSRLGNSFKGVIVGGVLLLSWVACAEMSIPAGIAERCHTEQQRREVRALIWQANESRDINCRNRQGLTLLELCMLEIHQDRADVVHKLLLAGASPHLPGINGMTPLHRAAYFNDYRSALRLLAFGARADVNDAAGRTPAQLTTLPQLQQLLQNGAPVECLTPATRKLWKQACAGHAAAQYELSTLYHGGEGSQVGSLSAWVNTAATPDADAAESRAWLEQAAAAGEPRALYELGIRLLWGRDGEQNEALARQYLQRAAAAGHEGAAELLSNTP